MSSPTPSSRHSVTTSQLREVLQECLESHFGRSCPIARLVRQPSAYRSSFPLEELHVHVSDGGLLSLIFKDLAWQGLTDDARRTKPRFLYDPRREIEIYRNVLAARGLGTAVCYGAVADPGLDRYWLFLEKVPAVELYQVGDFDVWRQVARWLAEMHAALSGPQDEPVRQVLLGYDADFFRAWIDRARSFLRRGASPASASQIDRLAAAYDRVIAQLAALPTTLIHGEFYASNVLVAPGAPSSRVCPVDWEMAGIGPGLIDLAALASGKWTRSERRCLAAAYLSALPAGSPYQANPESFHVAVDYCRLYLCVQWLGWAGDWTPPAEHAHDWLAEALRLVEELGL